jgi:hypothetical protein
MGWRSKFKEEVSPATEAELELPPTSVRPSPGLEAALGRLSEEDPARILDLGPAVGSNISYLSGFSTSIRVADIVGDRNPLSQSDDLEESEIQQLAEEALPDTWGTFDLVLAWHLFDYLDERPAKAVAGRFRELCGDAGCVFAVVTTTDEMPVVPPRYTIVDRGNVSVVIESLDRVQCPKWPPAMIGRFLKGFSIERSVVLRQGLQEFVAVRRG